VYFFLPWEEIQSSPLKFHWPEVLIELHLIARGPRNTGKEMQYLISIIVSATSHYPDIAPVNMNL
jgi:hypothetical protein